MTEEEISIAKRLVQSPNWEWMPGMLTIDSQFLSLVSDDMFPELCLRLPDYKNEHYPDQYDWPHDLGVRVPILNDPATLGCIHHLIRRLWATKETKTRPIPVVNISECDGKWEVGYRYGEVRVSIFFSDLEIEAIAWALENGP
jgi:hypothetical protein